MATFTYQRRIRETDLDFLGHVNHAVYLSILEEARWEMIEDQGFGFNELRKANVSPVILGVNIQYKKEIVNREVIEVETNTQAAITKVGTIEQMIRKQNGQVAATATITYGVMDLKERKLIHPPMIWNQAIGVDLSATTRS